MWDAAAFNKREEMDDAVLENEEDEALQDGSSCRGTLRGDEVSF